MTLNKTPLGTIAAKRWDNGITMGFYGLDSVLSLEYNHETNKIELLLNDTYLNIHDVDVFHVNEDWSKK